MWTATLLVILASGQFELFTRVAVAVASALGAAAITFFVLPPD